MLLLCTRTKIVQFFLLCFPSLVLLPYIVMAITLFSTRNAFAVYPTISGKGILNLTWNPLENESEHHRMGITWTDTMSESVIIRVSNAYIEDNHFQIGIEKGYSYILRVQGVNSYDHCYGFSEKATFSM